MDKLNVHKLTLICLVLYIVVRYPTGRPFFLKCYDHSYECEQKLLWKQPWKSLWQTQFKSKSIVKKFPSLVLDRPVPRVRYLLYFVL